LPQTSARWLPAFVSSGATAALLLASRCARCLSVVAPLRAMAVAAVRVKRSPGLCTSTAASTAKATWSWSAPASSAISKQCDACSCVMEASAVSILAPSTSAPGPAAPAATTATAAATLATETAACTRARSARALSTRLLESQWWNHFPIVWTV